MKIVQHLCVLVLCYAVGKGHPSLDGGRNDGEPDYDQGLNEFDKRYLMLFPEDFKGLK